MKSRHTQPPHSCSADELVRQLSTQADGLSEEEAKIRLVEYGPNELPEGKGFSPILLFLKQFKSWLVIMLMVAAIISWAAQQLVDAWIIIGVVFINAIIGFSQEYRAEKAIASLKKMVARVAKVIRAGQLLSIPAPQLVPGDMMVLEEGDSIPADGRIWRSSNFRTIEAPLTGESLPVSKNEAAIDIKTPLAERKNMVWKGTFVAGGYARCIVTGTGTDTAIGEISESLEAIQSERPNFIKKTDVLAKQMSAIAIASAVVLFLMGYFVSGLGFREILLISIAALVAAVPEGLPAMISIVLAIGANRMAKKNAIIRKFPATETLGAVTAILTDKTGTLTQNSLTVRKVLLPGEDEISVSGEGWFPAGNFSQRGKIIEPAAKSNLQKLLHISAVSNNAEIKHDKAKNSYELIGDPTEGALMVLTRKGGIQPEGLKSQKLDDLPFESQLRLRATLFNNNSGQELYVTGAPESLLEKSAFMLTPEGEVPLTEALKKKLYEQIADWSAQAMRVIALAYKKYELSKIEPAEIDRLVFAGIVGMIDPPRPDTKEAVEKCRQAGIRVIMVTGDHINTALAIARATGIVEKQTGDSIQALTGQQLEQLDEKEFDEAIQHISVFARLSPKMKLRIAERLQAASHLIAMTGDGVNDALALKKADVGISMGIMGTDVARDASDVVLSDDNFSTIVSAIEEGRIVFANARKTSFFLVTTNIAESVSLVAAITLGLPIPLTATQILWLNLVTDGVTDMALATEPGHGGIMKAKPLQRKENILNKRVLPFLVINVTIMAGLSLAVFFYYLNTSLEMARTGVFITMAFTQLFNVFNLRSLSKSIFSIGPFSNRFINWAIGASILLLILVTELPFLAGIFRFQPLATTDFLILLGLSSSVLWASELYKLIVRKTYTRHDKN